ncbi:MAG: hypothetical protein IT308_13080, partial [Anaerolineaceae bacterium]|nr:hypothetical protein [Anaerolineaceae bacterium]
MVLKRMELHQQEELPKLDEGWWNSILSDEGGVQNQSSLMGVPRREGTAGSSVGDWDFVRQVYENDERVEMMVYDSNRGG